MSNYTPNYTVRIYEENYLFYSNGQRFNTLIEAKYFAKRKMQEQRSYRPTTKPMYARIDGDFIATRYFSEKKLLG